MNHPIHIRFVGLEPSTALTAAAEVLAYGLPWTESEIMVCWVGIHKDVEYAHAGGAYGVRVDVTVPGYELVTHRVPHHDVYYALSQAFEDMARQLAAIDPRINHAEYAPTENGQLLPPLNSNSPMRHSP